MSDGNFSRRALLAAPAALLVSGSAVARTSKPERSLRLAHLTDVHVQPELAADKGMVACLKHVQALADRPQLILSGGDSVMDSFGQTRDRTKTQWNIWRDTIKGECGLPVEACIGNHDVWGWNKEGSKTTGNEPLHGKNWAVEALGIGKRYRSFDKAGWHFVVLDSTQPGPKPGSYTAYLDVEQFDWLAKDLAAVKSETPVLVMSHIPILSAAVFFDGENAKSGDWRVPGAWMHIDAARIKDLFGKYPNVKVCLSGHLHLVDRVDYNGVTYFCNGAVSGGWWKGNYHECAPGYAVLDLFPDGTFDRQYVTYGWEPKS
jgi:3',5'-cyclic-AMP phosphodiesterase